MQIIFFSSEFGIVNEWRTNHNIEHYQSAYDSTSLLEEIEKCPECLIVVDYDSVASELNKLLASGTTHDNIIVLERSPAVATGKMLITQGIKAYGNSRMLPVHFLQMLEEVLKGNIWTYPELTATLAKMAAAPKLNKDAQELIENRLSPQEINVVHHVLEGLTNDAIASKLEISTRTVKAHMSSIFSKLHVSDRISLVLLLK